MKIKQVKWGAILSYLLIIFNAAYGFLMTPYMVGCLGDAEYGVYKTISAFSGTLMVLDLGLGSTVLRYIAQYKAKQEEDKIPSFIGMSLVQATIMCGVIVVVSFGAYQTIEPAYANTFSAEQVDKAQLLFILLVFNILLHVFNNVISGVICGCNHFVFANGSKILRLLIRALFVIVLLRIIPNAAVTVVIDILYSLLFIIAELLYIKYRLRIKIKLGNIDSAVFLDSGKYTIMMFLSAVANQVNNNLDNVVVGAISGPEFVTVYSLGLVIFNMFQNLSTAISGVMLPTVSNILEKKDADKELTELIIRIGRIQFMILGAAFVGFACVGEQFFELWMGKGYDDAYYITLILMGPALLELCVNTCLTVLRAKHRLGFYTGVMIGAAVINALVTYFAVKYWSYIGAAFGTAVSFILGNLVVMNIYFAKKIHIPILYIYQKVMQRTFLCLLIAGGAMLITTRFLRGNIIAFTLNVIVFCVVYGVSLWFYGFDKSEKKSIPILCRFVK